MFNKLFIILLLCHFTSFSRQEEFSTIFSVKSKYNSSIEQSSFKDFLYDSIIIIDVDEVYYREGELYWRKDNSSYDGSSKRTGIWASILGKYSGFIGQTYNALKTIESGTKQRLMNLEFYLKYQ